MSARSTIECKPDGPYVVKNLDDLRSPAGASIAVKAVVPLCRCGASKNKPFCDGSHWTSVSRTDRTEAVNGEP